MPLKGMFRELAAAETARMKQQLRGLVVALMLTLSAGVLLLAGLAFAMLGAYQSLAERLPSWQAGGLVALGALVVCLLLLALAGRGGRKRPPPPPRRPLGRSLEADEAAEIGAAAGEALQRHRPRGIDLGIAAFVVGLMMSRSSRRPPP